ncbi:hypothetical protein K2173_007599 [Erythroxylum novogranatense]|uniref:MO25-like protein At5g47540 n=1 Tax=Erythroxylum novogranatense TaxID=1862640 RepID=A0AAV8S943_9ROSI|nr:hypothetical protein K2173_007599 [Erythroxylum novogranatense]
MKGLFKQKSYTPSELVQHMRDILVFFVDTTKEARERKREEKMSELNKLLLQMRTVLYGDGQKEPNSEACAQLTQHFFKDDSFRSLVLGLPKLDLGARRNATHVIANLQRQRVGGRLIASDYMENNLDIMDILLSGYSDDDIALTYGTISRECIRHQVVARYVLQSEHMKKLFDYIQIPNFDVASEALSTFKELLTRHKSTVAEFLSTNYGWFFEEYNTQLLQSSNYIIRRHALKFLFDILLERSNCDMMLRYVRSLDNLRILMNLFKDSNKTIQLETFHVFKLFVINQHKSPEVTSVLVTNRTKLLRFLGDFAIEKEDEQFEADKAQVIQEIAALEIEDRSFTVLECEIDC